MNTLSFNTADDKRCCDAEAAWQWVGCVAELALAGHVEVTVLVGAVAHALQAERLGFARPLGNLP